MARLVRFHVFRFDPRRDEQPYYQDYDVPCEEGWTVLSAIIYLKEKIDGTVAVRYSCRSGVCGSDGLVINGRSKLACKTQLIPELKGDGEVTLEPLRHMPVLKDLAVIQQPFFAKYKAVQPWLIPKDEPEPERERLMVMGERPFAELSKATDCIMCQICYSECPVEGVDRSFLGPAALVQAYRYEGDPRDSGSRERMGHSLDRQFGVWRCHTTFRCAESCPKDINGTWAIQQLKKKATAMRLGLSRGD